MWLRTVFRGRLHTVVKQHSFVTCSPFFRSLISPTGRNSGSIHALNSSNDVFCVVHVPLWGLEPSNSLLRVSVQKKNTLISTRFWTWPICSGNRFSNGAPESKLPLNVKITQQKLAFWLEVTNQEFLSHNGGVTGSVLFKMVAAFLYFEKLLPFLYYWINLHQIRWDCWEPNIEHNCYVKNYWWRPPPS